MDSLQAVIDFIDSHSPGFLSTKGTCGNPRVRPVQSALLHNGRIYFATATSKNLYKHIQNHSGIEYCVCAKDGSFLRLRGEARVVNHIDAKEAMFDKYPFIVEKYKSIENPEFVVFYIESLSVQLQDSQGQRIQYKQ